MLRIFSFILVFSFSFLTSLQSQDSTQLAMDSAGNAFILNHKPLSVNEFNKYNFVKRKVNAYGTLVQHYLINAESFAIGRKALGPEISKRKRVHLEWIFYSFAGLFMLLGLVRYLWGEYFDKVFLVYFNQGFILRQKKDAMMMWSLPSVLLNCLFVLSASFFIFFGLGSNNYLIGIDRWQVMLFFLIVISIVYLFKYFLLQFLGWMFKQKEAFEQYSFIVFLNNKIVGVVMLVSSFMMAFSGTDGYENIFKTVLYIIGILFGLRLINAFRIFGLQNKAGIFNILLAFISLEFLPTAMVLKFATKSLFLFKDGVLQNL